MVDSNAHGVPLHDDALAVARALEHGPAQSYCDAAEAVLAAVAACEAITAAAAGPEDLDLRAVGRRAEALVEVGNARRRLGDMSGALASLGEAAALGTLARSIDPDAGGWMGRAHHRTAIVHDALNDLPKAIDELGKAKVECERVDDETGVARVLNSLGIAYSRSGDLERALDLFRRSLDHAVATNDARRNRRSGRGRRGVRRWVGRARWPRRSVLPGRARAQLR
jgi:tetratricopeptide (TPR) repeat protein